jgi:hypothetical protein
VRSRRRGIPSLRERHREHVEKSLACPKDLIVIFFAALSRSGFENRASSDKQTLLHEHGRYSRWCIVDLVDKRGWVRVCRPWAGRTEAVFCTAGDQIRRSHAHGPTICDCGSEGLLRGASWWTAPRSPSAAGGPTRRAPGGAYDEAGAGARGEPAAWWRRHATAGRERPPARRPFRAAGAPDPRRPRLLAHDRRLRSQGPRARQQAGGRSPAAAGGPIATCA